MQRFARATVPVVLVSVLVAMGAAPARGAAPTVTLLPVADAYVYASQPDTNFGSNTGLRTDGSPLMHSYLRWDVTGRSGASRVELRVYAESANLAGVELRTVADTTWRETVVTYTTAPTLGPVIASSGPVSAGAWVTFDVTAHVAADGPVSFALTSGSSTATRFSSRNGPNPPQLVLTSG